MTWRATSAWHYTAVGTDCRASGVPRDAVCWHYPVRTALEQVVGFVPRPSPVVTVGSSHTLLATP